MSSERKVDQSGRWRVGQSSQEGEDLDCNFVGGQMIGENVEVAVLACVHKAPGLNGKPIGFPINLTALADGIITDVEINKHIGFSDTLPHIRHV